MRRKIAFLDFWGSKKEEQPLVRQPLPSELRKLLDNGALRAQLQNTKMVTLLPPIGTEVFRKFTPVSLEEIQRCRQVKEKEPHRKEDENILVTEAQRNAIGELESGKPLPFIFGDPPLEFVSTPLEELDPFYQTQKTFIVLDGRKIIHRFNSAPACFLLTPLNHVRTAAIKILLHFFFQAFILMTVLANCAFMTMAKPPEWSGVVKSTFICIYAFEVIVKVAARGFCLGQFTFLRDPWNWLDLMVIGTAYLTNVVDSETVSALQALPALKAITAIPGLKTTVSLLLQTVKKMAHVTALSLICLTVLAVLSLHIFMGYLKQKCVLMPPSNHSLDYFDFQEYINNPVNYYYQPGSIDALLCGNSSEAGICPEGYTCMRGGPNPNYGYTSYDSFGWAFLAMVRLMTQDFWENLFQLTLRSAGKTYTILFVVDLVVGSFSLVSLIVAVMALVSVEEKQVEMAEARQKDKEYAHILKILKKKVQEVPGTACLTKKQHSSADMEECEEEQRPCLPCCSTFTNIFLKWTCCSSCWAQQRLHHFVTDPFFDLAIVVCLVLNIIFMAMVHYPLTQEFAELLTIAELVFTGVFTAEMALKLLAMGPHFYFKVGWNIFDSIIVILTVLELGLENIYGLKLLRVFRLAKWWPAFSALLKLIGKSLGTLKRFTLLMAIVCFTFAVVGMQLFGKNYKENVCRISEDCTLPRWHMSDFFHSFLTIFRALYGEWIETMWDCMEVSGQPACLIFFTMMVVVGKLMGVNLFLALLINSSNGDVWGDSEGERQNNLLIALNRIKSWALERTGKKTGRKTQSRIDLNPPVLGLKSEEESHKELLPLTFVSSEEPESEVKVVGYNKPYKTASQASGNEAADEKKDLHHGESPECVCKRDEGNTPPKCFGDGCYQSCPVLNMDSCRNGLRIWMNLRRSCMSVVEHTCFEAFITFVILLSSVALAIEDIHLERRPLIRSILQYADQVFTCIFVLEMLLRWFSGGFKKYFTDAWRCLDFLIVLISLVSTTVDVLVISNVRAINSLRSLRPLRVLSRFEGTKVVGSTLFGAIPPILDVLLVCSTYWLIFSIMGVTLFAGKFYHCINDTSEELFHTQDVNNRTDCLMLMEQNWTEVRWSNLKINFDSVAIAYVSLLQVATFKGWLDLIYAAMDSRQIEMQPEYEANVYMSLYFVFFIIFGGFFTLNFLVGTIIEYLKQQKAKLGGTGLFMTKEQMKCYNSRKAIDLGKARKSVPRPQNKIQALLFDLVTKRSFDVLFTAFACLQLVVMTTETWDQSFEKETILFWIYFAFIVIFLAECVMKIIALRRHYFSFRWNIFDFVLVIWSILGLFLTDLLEKYFIHPGPLIIVIRLTRVIRILHLFRFSKGVRRLLYALMRSLPALFNIGLFLSVMMFIFAVFGMKNFAYVKKGALLDDMFNFETFGNSIICLLTITTTAGWDGLLFPIMRTPPDCDPDMENAGTSVVGDCGSPVVGVIFCVSYITLSFLVVVNMYLVVILENFNVASEENADEVCESDIEMFCETWERFDPHVSHYIHYSQLSEFCDNLKDPLRIPKPNSIKVISMDLPLAYGDKIHCLDLLVALTAQVLGISGETDNLRATMEEKLLACSTFKVMGSFQPVSSTLRRKREDIAATVIQRAYRKHATAKTGEANRIICHDGDEEESVQARLAGLL
ncbi:sodium channel protein type 4 subunit alpha B [Syngnathoides biaculeatus]|uniref:sodium channel protein type 4 subunit alpha B n=1 Tax=Syngnathoides biaculeatus TaxID=300417 RepID=UPI002ADD3BDB|nr:sodium channel protein type 4 subunit alpha B [Syngnathoides biaculeatus]